MAAESPTLISIKQAAKILGVTKQTLRNWEAAGTLVPSRTAGGHRRYTKAQVLKFQQLQAGPPPQLPTLPNPTEELSLQPNQPLFQPLHSGQKKFIRAMSAFGAATLLFLFGFLDLQAAGLITPMPGSGSRLATSQPTTTRGRVLQAATSLDDPTFEVNVPTIFRDIVTFEENIFAAGLTTLNDVEVTGDMNIIGQLTLTGSLTVPDTLTVGGAVTNIAGTLNLIGNLLTSDGDLVIDPAGGGVSIGTGTPDTIDLDDGDLFITDDLEVADDLVVGGTITGDGSGLTNLNTSSDADTLDDLDSTQFLRSDADDEFTGGTLTIAGGSALTIAGTFTVGTIGSSGDLVIDPDGGGVSIGTGTPGSIDLAGGDLFVTDDLEVGGIIYGDGSGLTNLPAGDADTLDGFDSTQFLRSDTSDTYTSGTLDFADGTFLDLAAILHDDTALQGLRLPQATTLTNPVSGEGFIAWDSDDNALLVYDGTAWTSPGISGSGVAGQITFWDSSSSITGDTGLTFDSVTDILTIGSGGKINPAVDLGADLGTALLRWNNLYVNSINTNTTASFEGQAIFTYDPADTTFTESSVLINPTAPATNEWLLGIGAGGNQRAGIDADGDLTLGYNSGVTAPATDNPLTIYGHSATEVFHISLSGNFVSANQIDWTLADAVNALNIDADTLSIDALNDQVGIGLIAPLAKLHVEGQTEQLRLSYDLSNYVSFTVGSTGGLTIDSVGTANSITLSDLTADRLVTTTTGGELTTTISSANLAESVTDETGTGSLVFSADPTFTGITTHDTVSTTNFSCTGCIGPNNIASAAVGSAKLKTSTGSQSGTVTGGGGAVLVTMNDYSFSPSVFAAIVTVHMTAQATTNSCCVGRFVLFNQDASNRAYQVQWRYVTASRDQEIFAWYDPDNGILRNVWSSEVQLPDSLPNESDDYDPSWIPVQATIYDDSLTNLGETPDTQNILENYTFSEVAKASEIDDSHPLKAERIAERQLCLEKNNGNESKCFQFITHPDIYYGRLVRSETSGIVHAQLQAKLEAQMEANLNITGADLAEYYDGPADVEAGQVLGISDSNILVPTETEYAANLAGVASTSPGMILGNPDSGDIKLALTGRVPVKIASDSAAILPGDTLTSSSQTGRAMKATKAGPTLGKALEAWDPANPTDSILVFITLGSYLGEFTSDGYLDMGQSLAANDLLLHNTTLYNRLYRELDLTSESSQSATPAASVSQSLERILDRVESLESATGSATLSITNLLEVLGQLVVEGVATFKDAVTFLADVTFGGRVTYSDRDIAGFATVPAGQTQVRVEFDRAYQQTPIVNITLRSQVNLDYYRVTSDSASGFTIEIAATQAQDVVFSWSAVAVTNAAQIQTNETQAPAVSAEETEPIPETEPVILPTPTPLDDDELLEPDLDTEEASSSAQTTAEITPAQTATDSGQL
jgi:excisionase family DNA binding protein